MTLLPTEDISPTISFQHRTPCFGFGKNLGRQKRYIRIFNRPERYECRPTTCLQDLPGGKGEVLQCLIFLHDDIRLLGREYTDGDEEGWQKHIWGTFSSFSPRTISLDVMHGEGPKRVRFTEHIAPFFDCRSLRFIADFVV